MNHCCEKLVYPVAAAVVARLYESCNEHCLQGTYLCAPSGNVCDTCNAPRVHLFFYPHSVYLQCALNYMRQCSVAVAHTVENRFHEGCEPVLRLNFLSTFEIYLRQLKSCSRIYMYVCALIQQNKEENKRKTLRNKTIIQFDI